MTLNKTIRHTIESKLSELRAIEKVTHEICQTCGLSVDQQENISIAVTEAVGNAIVHGNKYDPSKKVMIDYHITDRDIEISIEDEGEGFNPETVPDPLHPDNLMKENGRGIFILTELMDDVQYDMSGPGTKIKLILHYA